MKTIGSHIITGILRRISRIWDLGNRDAGFFASTSGNGNCGGKRVFSHGDMNDEEWIMALVRTREMENMT